MLALAAVGAATQLGNLNEPILVRQLLGEVVT